jgi:putative ABC transport system ATP-binding protein
LAGAPIDRAYANEILTQLGINNLSTRYPRQLSQGQAQRVAIARAVVHRPSLLIADEPTSALDDANTAEAIGLLKNLSEHNDAALIVVTHDERIRSTLNNSFDLQAMV